MPPPTEPPLEEDVATGRETEIRVAPFSIASLTVPERWDPSHERLPTSFTLVDPNAQIRRGRLAVYDCPPLPSTTEPPALGSPIGDQTAVPPGDPETDPIFTLTLTAAELTHGDHTLAEDRRWDGRVPSAEGRAPGPFWARLELWNTDDAEPPTVDPEAEGAAVVAVAGAMVAIDVVVEARWSRPSVLPSEDPDEPSRGKVTLDLRVKNIPNRTAVELLVARVGTIDDPGTDLIYEFSGRDAANQPGLEHATVRDGRVLVRGERPEIEFRNFAEHWKYPGNNFYVMWMRVGDSPRWVPVTERDYRTNEARSLHMRFTVLVHVGSTDNPVRTAAAQAIGDFLNDETRYFHATLKTTPMSDPVEYRRQFRNRYIVLYLGHAFVDCLHDDHPRSATDPTVPTDHLHVGYPPDLLVCPNSYRSDEDHRWSDDYAAHYAAPVLPGCGQYHNYRTMTMAGSNLILLNHRGRAPTDPDYVQVGNRGPNRGIANGVTIAPADAPRFLFYVGGCRTATTDSLIGYFNDAGTRYTHGWVYSVESGVNAGFAQTLFRRWIKETGADVGADEWDADRFHRIYAEVAADTDRARFEPRLRSVEQRESFPPPPPGAAASALE